MKTLLVLLCLVAPAFAQQLIPSGMVRVYVRDRGIENSMGSGALISPTLVLTNRHVIKDRRTNRDVHVRFSDGTRSEAVILENNKLWDIVLLEVQATTVKPFAVGERPKPGERATIHGFGKDYDYLADTGTISQTFYMPSKGEDAKDMFFVDGPVARNGDSGGPVTDAKGRLIGILFGSGDTVEHGRETGGTTIDRIRKICGPKFKPSLNPPEETDYILYDKRR